ncbi:MAG TPA: bifunctional aldolase/short-chain dehydrogenase [Acidiferrobacteraceae bacterium]|nr:bifunctional aldolase/short-chain dehydrogenase [Acidiferrobacteraceae bacterium]HEX20692.1 bifunctional aldolase/short-chain dehydrogenase [Acidiferrobacteraceae bacterium]
MKSLWNNKDTAQCQDALDLRVYSSRLLGGEPSLVLHGGGNTSVKITERNQLGEDEARLYVKGSGWDLATIERPGFAPVRLAHLQALAELPTLSDPDMVNELKTQTTIASAPTPSVETILHAILPYTYVDHTHADAVVTVTNTPGGEQHIKEIYGDSVVVIPYTMPGFDLARVCAERFTRERTDNTIGMVLMNHGIFSFADDARKSYERMIDLVTRAEDFLKARGAWELPDWKPQPSATDMRHGLASLRQQISEQAGFAVIMRNQGDAAMLGFTRHPDIKTISQQGPATPDHVIRTKRLPMLGRDVAAYAGQYQHYFDEHEKNAKEAKTILDRAPRLVLDPELGLCAVGKSARDAVIVQELYQHTMEIILRATALEQYQALPAQDIFDVEYWDLEQAKLRRDGKPPMFQGEVAVVTGAASGIGKACVDSLLARGAAVVGWDINPAITDVHQGPNYLGLECDVTDVNAVQSALEQGVRAFGGLDMLILNAGMFPPAMPIADMELDAWQQTLDLNLTANMTLLRESHALLQQAPQGGRVVVIGSKNVAAPGPGAGAYSAAKAALNQLMRVTALEWGKEHIRINTLHPDAVFDTGIWTEEVLQSRAKSYGITVEQYKKRNLLQIEICSRDVAELAAEMCGPLFARTTAAQVPIDGGDVRVI